VQADKNNVEKLSSALSPNRNIDIPLTEFSQSTTLSVGSVKATSNGNGTFHTLVPIRPGKPNMSYPANEDSHVSPVLVSAHTMMMGSPTVRIPADPETWLRARYIYMVGEKPQPFNPNAIWGAWISMVPKRIGHSSALNDATASFIAANIARHDMTEENIAAARASYSKALKSVQKAVTKAYTREVTSETLAAVKMLAAFEVGSPRKRVKFTF
jgi:hypothetical protein